jgi:hypothetical protein
MILPFRTASARPVDSTRRCFIGGPNARIILARMRPPLVRLWREKRGEAEPFDYSDNLIVQLGVVTEPLNHLVRENDRADYLRRPELGSASSDPLDVRHPVIRWMAATLDGLVEATDAVFEAKFVLPRSFSTWRRSNTTCGSPIPPRQDRARWCIPRPKSQAFFGQLSQSVQWRSDITSNSFGSSTAIPASRRSEIWPNFAAINRGSPLNFSCRLPRRWLGVEALEPRSARQQ